MLLQEGLTRGEVAAKLGIGRAIELNRFYFGVTPEPKTRRAKAKDSDRHVE
jgi:hypothetical protein